MNYSYFEECGNIRFPEFKAERHYMVPFFQKTGLPAPLKHWQPTVDAMLETVQTDKEIYLMVDQAQVLPNTSHRRGGVHVDNVWTINCHSVGHESSHHNPPSGGHAGGHRGGGDSHLPSWLRTPKPPLKRKKKLSEAEQLIILASDYAACAAYEGEWEGFVEDKGDCSHIDISGLTAKILLANRAYKGDTTQMLHESLPIPVACNRTVVRLNVNL
jgi:hypothetical protein